MGSWWGVELSYASVSFHRIIEWLRLEEILKIIMFQPPAMNWLPLTSSGCLSNLASSTYRNGGFSPITTSVGCCIFHYLMQLSLKLVLSFLMMKWVP